MKRAVLVVVLLLSACALPPHYEYVWEAPDVAQFHRDEVQCQQYAFQALTASGATGSNQYFEMYKDDCLLQLGYVRTAHKVAP